MSEYVDEEVTEAHDALADAQKMYEAGVTDKAIVTRLYYACFHATNAVLYSKGFTPQTHQGTIRLFGKEIVKSGEASREAGRFLNDMRSYRQTADYSHDPLNADVQKLLGRTETFVADLEKLID